MPLNIPESAPSDFPELPVGGYQAVISALWDIGVQKSEYQGQVKENQQLIIRYEINKTIPSGKFEGDRYTINAWTNIPKSFDDRSIFIKLRNAAEGMQTVASDYVNYNEQDLIGKNVILNVSHTKKGKPKIESIGSLMDGIPVIQPILRSSLEETPEWVQKQKEKAINYKPQSSTEGQFSAPSAPEDDLPF
jgi:hypothetical protein